MTNDSKIVLRCENLSKFYIERDAKIQVLDSISLEVSVGEKIAIIGSSGSGKTTLLNLLGGLDKPSTGSVEVAGSKWSDMSENQRASWRNRHLGFVYQFHHLLGEFTSIENVAMPLLIKGISISQAKIMSKEILSQVGLIDRCDHRPSSLSGGERQRVAIARALVSHPACVLMDEPTGNLDYFSSEAVLDTISYLNIEFDVSFILVTHDTNVASKMDRILSLKHGDLKAHDLSEKIIRPPTNA